MNSNLAQLSTLVSNVPVLRAAPAVLGRAAGALASAATYLVRVALLDAPGKTAAGTNVGDVLVAGVYAATVSIADTTTPTPTLGVLGKLLTISGAVSDTETITITSGGATDIYEFNSTGGFTSGRIEVPVPVTPTTFECLEALLKAMTVRAGGVSRAQFKAAILSPTTLLVYHDTVQPTVSEAMANGAFTDVMPLVDGSGVGTVTLPAGSYLAAEKVTVMVAAGVMPDGRTVPGSRSTLTFT